MQRRAWLPYFEQVNAIIFLAPISCFDERLAEDPRVNRLEDSFLLWKAICSSQLLTSTTLIIFLNKRDLLEKKIAAGIQINRYLPSYADRPNETKAIIKCNVARSDAVHPKLTASRPRDEIQGSCRQPLPKGPHMSCLHNIRYRKSSLACWQAAMTDRVSSG